MSCPLLTRAPLTHQVQSCPSPDSCTYDSRQSTLLAFQQAMYSGTTVVFSTNGTLLNATAAALYQVMDAHDMTLRSRSYCLIYTRELSTLSDVH